LNFNIDVEISIVDLEKDTQSYGNVKHACNTVWKTCDFLKETGALALGFEVKCPIFISMLTVASTVFLISGAKAVAVDLASHVFLDLGLLGFISR
jgi:hypothetical protein